RPRGDRLVALAGPAARVRVLEGREVVEALRCKDDVVLLRAAELDQTQLGLHPVDAVLALGVAREVRPRRQFRAVLVRQLPGDVVHADDVAIAEDRVVAATAPLPRRIVYEHNLPWHGRLQPQLQAVA